jgi:hypothetical protein
MNYVWTKESSRLNVDASETNSAGKTNTELLWEAQEWKTGSKSWTIEKIHSSGKHCAVTTTSSSFMAFITLH